MKVDLVWLSNNEDMPNWEYGNVWVSPPTPQGVAACMQRNLYTSQSEAWLFWDSNFGVADSELIFRALKRPGDVWHAGLRLGMGGKPVILDFIHPTWMLNRDPDDCIEASSWRLSLRCCLVKRDVLLQMGGPAEVFRSLDAAGLELGYRYIRHGVIVRHLPWLLPAVDTKPQINITFEDEYRFLCLHHPHRWRLWVLFRALLTNYTSLVKGFQAYKSTRAAWPSPARKIYQHPKTDEVDIPSNIQVSVIIPTIYRYSYLRTLLNQLRQQTILAHEILIIDQTPIAERDINLVTDFADLPIKLFTLDNPGQCSARNLGLIHASGDHILFIDDDDEIKLDVIARHLANLRHFDCGVSSGVVDDPSAGSLPENFTYLRTSDVFPTNNTMIHKDILHASGLFDLAYDRGKRADGDLGMRIYLSGALMVLDPSISVFHHHAPVGGLRTHGTRKITYASSRQSLTQRHLLSSHEIYLANRFFNSRQVREVYWLNVLGTFSLKGSGIKKVLKLISSSFMLIDSLVQTAKNRHKASRMLEQYPQIPVLE